VLDGNGLAVSEARGVGVSVSVEVGTPVADGRKGVSVTGGNVVLVGRLVSAKGEGIGVDVRVQANELMIQRIRKKGFRFICGICSPLRIIYPND
jgi:hypothetical protein